MREQRTGFEKKVQKLFAYIDFQNSCVLIIGFASAITESSQIACVYEC